MFKIRSATSVLRRVVRSGYKEADLRYEKSGGAERTVRFSFLNGLALSGQAPAAADARRGVFRPERICGLHAAGAVPHCAAGGGSAGEQCIQTMFMRVDFSDSDILYTRNYSVYASLG